jgi:hypothetical protein
MDLGYLDWRTCHMNSIFEGHFPYFLRSGRF